MRNCGGAGLAGGGSSAGPCSQMQARAGSPIAQRRNQFLPSALLPPLPSASSAPGGDLIGAKLADQMTN